ncbi:hypothetical protein POF45_01190 [Pseudomonas sp. 681]|uniref:Uncharacterized protein n=1 Tax=Pseudomonas fungipugnans TaxID=3024217 RepID=A0ABT6QGP2_9PSED|nr:hypothetical protein [Pseudomonas sp. 681]MDI2590047.1 hypothetical protein [Pseudomonas sp. 681]
MDPYEIEDTSDWLGSPTELETCRHFLLMAENEIQELTLQLRKAREDVFGLVQMNSQLSDEKSKLSRELKETLAHISRLNSDASELNRALGSLKEIKAQRDRLLWEHQERFRQSLNE